MAGDVDTGDVSTEGLCRHIAGFLEVPDDTAIAEHVGRILAALDRLALIEPADGC